MNDDRQRRSDFCSRMVSEPNVFLDSFSYPDNSQASDTVSVDSSDSLETSFSACSPDNISRLERNCDDVWMKGLWKVQTVQICVNQKKKSCIFRKRSWSIKAPEDLQERYSEDQGKTRNAFGFWKRVWCAVFVSDERQTYPHDILLFFRFLTNSYIHITKIGSKKWT